MEINIPDWAKGLNCAVTVCDRQGIIVYMNDKSMATFGGKSLVGQSMLGCHSPRSQEIIYRLIDKGESNCYTIEKQGVKKLIYQTPWYNNGELSGLVELSIVLPDQMPHYVR